MSGMGELSWSLKTMPKKEKVASPGEAGTTPLNSSCLSAPKYSINVLAVRFLFLPGLPFGWSTSEKTAPKPLTVARTDWPPGGTGMKNKASVMLVPAGVNNRNGLNGAKMVP